MREHHVAVGVVCGGELDGLVVNGPPEGEGELPLGKVCAVEDLLCDDSDVDGLRLVRVHEGRRIDVLDVGRERAGLVVGNRHLNLMAASVIPHAAGLAPDLGDRIGIRPGRGVLDRAERHRAVGGILCRAHGLSVGVKKDELELAGREVATLEDLAGVDRRARRARAIAVLEHEVDRLDDLGAQVSGSVVGDLDVDVTGRVRIVGHAVQAAGLGDDVVEHAAARARGLVGRCHGVSLGVGGVGGVDALLHTRAAQRIAAAIHPTRHGSLGLHGLGGDFLNHRRVS